MNVPVGQSVTTLDSESECSESDVESESESQSSDDDIESDFDSDEPCNDNDIDQSKDITVNQWVMVSFACSGKTYKKNVFIGQIRKIDGDNSFSGNTDHMLISGFTHKQRMFVPF